MKRGAKSTKMKYNVLCAVLALERFSIFFTIIIIRVFL